ncbi:MAG: osmotically inducible protein OsmC [Flavobacteriaceae bacterium CG2_30_34_30]|nr:OsmC family peroxiredoxin [Flavobacteriia bacterium]OIP49904.1 MAG: osmotically inducible protein OsmC [Flavobacteriaceae bacterium CG2_30_34_30]PIQ18668.1 MAG: osmotically inducible protein OsmC [Flavobacteriaceae bacterium CG18_big_fil_WC_8_21_14_2_50_34_36]PIV51132.1 MAG: osmotically inducible protein OsmC [Flavobacteriaceae bacterium CG02_land_8_20_14_3_00_34_13]
METNHQYEVNLQWVQDRKGIIQSPVLPLKIEVATPPDFPKGMPDIWSPEHLFVAAVNSCLMTTFLAIAENSKLDFIRFESNAVGNVEQVDGKFKVTEIILKPVVTIPSSMNADRAERIVQKSEANCLISNSITTKISLETKIIVA